MIYKTINVDGTDNTKYIKLIADAISCIDNCLKPIEINGEILSSSEIYTQFSDCIVISFLTSETSGVFDILIEIQWILLSLVAKGILCRGGIAVGRLIHTKNHLFGPSFIDAYILESKKAIYPRVIVPEEVVTIGKQNHARHHTPDMEEGYIVSCLKQDDDGIYYIDYLCAIESELDDAEYSYPEYLHCISEILGKGLKQTEPSVLKKYEWLRKKYNKIVLEIKRNIVNINLEEEIADCLMSLPIY